jgi:hypothetical protein
MPLLLLRGMHATQPPEASRGRRAPNLYVGLPCCAAMLLLRTACYSALATALSATATPRSSSAARTAQRCKMLLTRLLARARVGLQDNDHIVEAGDVAFRHSCQPGLEGIVSKRLGSRYTSGRTRDWIKMKNPAAPAVKREAEEDWGR